MGDRVLWKQVSDQDVYELALQRTREAFARFDRVVVGFSGGKDSTCVLQLALKVAEEVGRLPLDVYFWDEEAILPETHDYVDRVRQMPGVRLRWLCWPIKQRNACSKLEPYWWAWDPEHEDRWVRPMPEWAEREPEDFDRGPYREQAHLLWPASNGETVGALLGLRAEESLKRYISCATREHDNWLTAESGAPHIMVCKPIYDWTDHDVWVAPMQFGWDYNRAYDRMQLAGIPLRNQRISTPFGEQPLEAMEYTPECWPEFYNRLRRRVSGVDSALRLAKTFLYGYGEQPRPDDGDWKGAILDACRQWGPKGKQVHANVADMIRRHNAETLGSEIPEEDPHEVTGLSWRALLNYALRGDFKGRMKIGKYMTGREVS